jgi:hypothetical protein
MNNKTNHGDNIANQIQTEDAYGNFDAMNESDLYQILDNFQTHLIDTNGNDSLIELLSKWMEELYNNYEIDN